MLLHVRTVLVETAAAAAQAEERAYFYVDGLQLRDDAALEKAGAVLAASKRLASEMRAVSGQMQRQVAVNVARLTTAVKKKRYNTIISFLLYNMVDFLGVSEGNLTSAIVCATHLFYF